MPSAIEPPPRLAPERHAAPLPAPEPPPVEEEPPSWDQQADETPEAAAADALSSLGDVGALSDVDERPTPDEDAIEIEETDTTLEEMVSAADLPSAEEIVGPPDLGVEDGPRIDAGAYEPPEPRLEPFSAAPSPFDDNPAIESEELFDLPPTPSWHEVVENCLTIAGARGTMLIDPQGLVLASHGFWPEPGPEPIAKKLVAMMEKTLKDAPTRSVSAPVGAMHLTAWRVPLAEGLITVAFLGDTPLRPEARTPVDAEILRGAP
jgi:hypothetical protein